MKTLHIVSIFYSHIELLEYQYNSLLKYLPQDIIPIFHYGISSIDENERQSAIAFCNKNNLEYTLCWNDIPNDWNWNNHPFALNKIIYNLDYLDFFSDIMILDTDCFPTKDMTEILDIYYKDGYLHHLDSSYPNYASRILPFIMIEKLYYLLRCNFSECIIGDTHYDAGALLISELKQPSNLFYKKIFLDNILETEKKRWSNMQERYELFQDNFLHLCGYSHVKRNSSLQETIDKALLLFNKK